MKRTKKGYLLLALLLLVTLCGGCAAGSTKMMDAAESMSDGMSQAAPKAASSYAYATNDTAYEAAPGDVSFDRASAILSQSNVNEKIIYTGSANVETIHFEDTVQAVYDLVARYNGFFESAYVTGQDYYTEHYGRSAYRSANFTIRVPRDSFQSLNGDLDSLGSVTYSSVRSENITPRYTDTESRLKAYRTEEERLLYMLEKAETVDDMLIIESRLSDVRYDIESLTTTLSGWDRQVDYSTLELSVSEVRELTEVKPITRTFGEEVSEGLRTSWNWLKRAVRATVVFLITAFPILFPPIVVLIVIWRVLRTRKCKKKKTHSKNDVKDDD